MLCGKAEESHAFMRMKMEQLAVPSVRRPNEIPKFLEHGRTKRTKTKQNTNMHRT